MMNTNGDGNHLLVVLSLSLTTMKTLKNSPEVPRSFFT